MFNSKDTIPFYMAKRKAWTKAGCPSGKLKNIKTGRCHKIYWPGLSPSSSVNPGKIEKWKIGKVRVLRTDRGKIIRWKKIK